MQDTAMKILVTLPYNIEVIPKVVGLSQEQVEFLMSQGEIYCIRDKIVRI